MNYIMKMQTKDDSGEVQYSDYDMILNYADEICIGKATDTYLNCDLKTIFILKFVN